MDLVATMCRTLAITSDLEDRVEYKHFDLWKFTCKKKKNQKKKKKKKKKK